MYKICTYIVFTFLTYSTVSLRLFPNFPRTLIRQKRKIIKYLAFYSGSLYLRIM